MDPWLGGAFEALEKLLVNKILLSPNAGNMFGSGCGVSGFGLGRPLGMQTLSTRGSPQFCLQGLVQGRGSGIFGFSEWGRGFRSRKLLVSGFGSFLIRA